MISAPITESNALFTNLANNNNKDIVTAKNGQLPSFAKTMQKVNEQTNHTSSDHTSAAENTVSAKQDETTSVKPDMKKTDTSVKSQTETGQEQNETKEIQQKDMPKDVTETEESDPITAEMSEAVLKVSKEMLQKIAKLLQMSEEEVLDAMNCIGMQMVDLLDQNQLTDLFVELSGTDMMSLVTNESLYNNLQDISQELQNALTDLTEDLGISDEKLRQICLDVEGKMQTVDVSKQNQDFVQTLMNQGMNDDSDIQTDFQKNKQDIPYTNQNDDINKEMKSELSAEQNENVPSAEQSENMQMQQENQQNSKDATDSHKHSETHPEVHAEYQSNHANMAFDDVSFDAEAAVLDSNTEIPDTDRIMKQIMDYMHVRGKEEITELEMQLHPASLGTVNLQIAQRAGAVTAQFTVQNEAVKSAMETQIVQLKENLESQGVKVEAVEVTLASHGFERNLSDQNRERQQQEENAKVKSTRRRIINLNEYEALDSLEEDDDATRIAMEMMSSNGNSLDMMA